MKTTQTITVTTPVGNFTKGQTIEVTDIQSILTQMLTKDSNPTTTQPSVSITLTGAGAKEVGTEFIPSYSANLNIGSYSNNKDGAQPTGVTAQTWTVTDTNSGSASTQTGSFTKFTVEDSTNYKVSVSVTHSAGNIPTTYLGTPYPEGQIKAGSKSATSSAVTVYGARKLAQEAAQTAAWDSVSGKPTNVTGDGITVNLETKTVAVSAIDGAKISGTVANANNAVNATSATQDAAGNVITETYATKEALEEATLVWGEF